MHRRLALTALVPEHFDADGWEEVPGKMWSERVGYHKRGENLSQFLSQALSIPDAEAVCCEPRGTDD